jgi:hypothetical protein
LTSCSIDFLVAFWLRVALVRKKGPARRVMSALVLVGSRDTDAGSALRRTAAGLLAIVLGADPQFIRRGRWGWAPVWSRSVRR